MKISAFFLSFSILLSQLAFADIKNANKALKDRNYETAIKEFTLAAEQGDADAAKKLGDIYATKESGFQDLELSFKWHKSAMNGYEKKNPVQAVKWWVISSVLNQDEMEIMMGRAIFSEHLDEDGYEKAMVLAKEWLAENKR